MKIQNKKQNGNFLFYFRDAEKEQLCLKITDLNEKLEKS